MVTKRDEADMVELPDELEELIRRAGQYDPKLRLSGKPATGVAFEAIARLLALNYENLRKQDRLEKIIYIFAFCEVVLSAIQVWFIYFPKS